MRYREPGKPRRCAYHTCGKEIPKGRQKFCSTRCLEAFHRHRDNRRMHIGGPATVCQHSGEWYSYGWSHEHGQYTHVCADCGTVLHTESPIHPPRKERAMR